MVDAPGWSSSFSLTEIPEGDKQRFNFLLVIPIDWFLCGSEEDSGGAHEGPGGAGLEIHHGAVQETIEQHMESEGDALKWCKYLYIFYICIYI